MPPHAVHLLPNENIVEILQFGNVRACSEDVILSIDCINTHPTTEKIIKIINEKRSAKCKNIFVITTDEIINELPDESSTGNITKVPHASRIQDHVAFANIRE